MNNGFTLVEILVVVAILSFMIAATYGVLNIGNIIYKDDMTLVQLQQQARQAMAAMVNELRESVNVIPSDGNTKITFNVVPEVYGDPLVGPISYYRVVGQVIREYPQNEWKILANDITSLSFCLTGNIVEIQVAAQKDIGARQLCFPAPCETPRKTLKETVWLRN